MECINNDLGAHITVERCAYNTRSTVSKGSHSVEKVSNMFNSCVYTFHSCFILISALVKNHS